MSILFRILPMAACLGLNAYQTCHALEERAEDLSFARLCVPQAAHRFAISAPDDDDDSILPEALRLLPFSTESGLCLPVALDIPGRTPALPRLSAGCEPAVSQGLSPPSGSLDSFVFSPPSKRLLCSARLAAAPPAV